MKKFLLVAIVAMISIGASAQDGLYVGGAFNLWRNSTANTTEFKIAPEVGYNLNKTWAVGVEFGYAHNYASSQTVNSFAVAPYARWSFYQNSIVRLFVDGTAGIGVTKVKDGDTHKAYTIGLKPGIALKVSDHFSFLAKYGFLGYEKDMLNVEGKQFGFNFDSNNLVLGFTYDF